MRIDIEYDPRPQFIPFHQRDDRWACIVAHRRCGKTVACVNDIVPRALYNSRKHPRYAYIAPFYRQAKEIAWQYLKDCARPAIAKVREAELSVELVNGAKITLYGADNPDALRGVYNDGVILDEFGDMRPSLWGEVILPTLADRRGWAVFIGTPKGKNHFYDMYVRSKSEPGWFSLTLPASETSLLTTDELAEMKSQMSDEQYRQEFLCDFTAAILGTYYARLLEGVRSCAYDPSQKVNIAFDLGYTDSTAMWFWQERPDGIAVIDYEEAAGQALAYYFDLLRYKGYEYDTLWLPHDARAKSLQTGRSTIEQFIAEKFPVRIAPNLSIQHGIDAARKIIPCAAFAPAAAAGVEALRSYRRSWDEHGKVFRDSPVHDWTSHAADAWRYLCLVTRERIVAPSELSTPVDTYGFTLEDLWNNQPGQTIRI